MPLAPRDFSDITPKIFTVTEVTRQIRELLESNFPEICITGEISNFRPAASGHFYFSLKDATAQIRAVMFRGANSRLKFRPEDGLEVICFGRVAVYEPRGEYQIIAEHMEPKGVGALQLAFEQLKKKLEAEGLFDPAHKKPLPFLPKKIGIVTSPTGAAIRDMLTILTRRFPNIEILVAPVPVQGDNAAPEIAQAIRELNQQRGIDLILAGRGGGSVEDLWAFNEEVVARAIFESQIPIISAVGHETDFTIADFVADLRAPTPSAAAELAVPVKEELEETTGQLKNRLRRAILQTLENGRLQVRQWTNLLGDPSRRLAELALRLDQTTERLIAGTNHGLEIRRENFAGLRRHLEGLSPRKILARGYAIVTRKGSPLPLKKAQGLKKEELLNIQLHDGSAEAGVVKINF
ncbi:MAG: exodeoxyribonuclease VII large subunit [Deltaproteobacteria bacterium]|nr:exodeoxyribonuclease VII large subunit [Deltaproteobacteria bacterium]